MKLQKEKKRQKDEQGMGVTPESHEREMKFVENALAAHGVDYVVVGHDQPTLMTMASDRVDKLEKVEVDQHGVVVDPSENNRRRTARIESKLKMDMAKARELMLGGPLSKVQLDHLTKQATVVAMYTAWETLCQGNSPAEIDEAKDRLDNCKFQGGKITKGAVRAWLVDVDKRWRAFNTVAPQDERISQKTIIRAVLHDRKLWKDYQGVLRILRVEHSLGALTLMGKGNTVEQRLGDEELQLLKEPEKDESGDETDSGSDASDEGKKGHEANTAQGGGRGGGGGYRRQQQGRGGGGRGGGGNRAAGVRGICYEYKAKGTCKFGDDCKFSHSKMCARCGGAGHEVGVCPSKP